MKQVGMTSMARQSTAVVLLFVPILILNTLRLFVPPLKKMLELSGYLDISLHVVCLGIGILLYRKTRTIRDHEWRRSKAVKSVSRHFKAEESGVWEKNIEMESNLSEEAQINLQGQVSSVTSGKNLGLQEISDEVEVEMLIDSDRVRMAQARVAGEEQFDEAGVAATYGAVRKPSPMDRFLDWISQIRGKDSETKRLEKSKNSLETRSQESPVIAQRPIAPITPIATDRKNPRPMEIQSFTDSGMETISLENKEIEVVPKQPTMEELAYGAPQVNSSNNIASAPGFQPMPTCRVCNSPNPIGERFCSNCGSNL